MDAMTFDTFVKLAVPAVSILIGAGTATALYSWRLAAKLTSIDAQFRSLHEKLDSDTKLREAGDALRAAEQKHQADLLTRDVAALSGRVKALEDNLKPVK